MSISQITVEHNPTPAKLEVMGIDNWPIWNKGVSKFTWIYDSDETCYFLTGEAIITPDGGEPLHLVSGDLVHFSAGISCSWDIITPVTKHYRLATTISV